MSKIDFANKTLVRDYYSLDKAVAIIRTYIEGFDVDDLLHLAATSIIPLSWHIPEFSALDTFIECDETKYFTDYLDKINSGESIDEIRIDEYTALHNILRHEVEHGDEFGEFKVKLVSDDFSGLINASISGVWDLSPWGSEFIERYKKAKASDLAWLYPTNFSEDSSFISIIAHENRKVSLNDLVITKYNLDSLLSIDEINKKTELQKKTPTIFDGAHTKEYHAAKRESVLKAAIFMKVNHPELCINNTKWAGAINDHAYKFWENGSPPLSEKKISELLGQSLTSR